VQDLFERTVFKSGVGGSDYDPHTFTMYLNWTDSNRPSGPITLHETLHWIQYISYTFCGFINALIHMRDELSKQILIKYANLKDDCQKHQVRFSLPEGKAFFNFYFDHEGMERNIHLHQIAWRDAFICENLFLYMSSFYKEYSKEMSSAHEILQPELLIPRTLLRVNNWAIGTLCYSSVKPRANLELTDFANHPKLSNFGRAIHAGIELDSEDIIEGMSVAFELYALVSNGMEEQAKERLKKIKIPANAYYLHAIEIFLKIMGFPVKYDNDEEIKETALNIARTALIFLAVVEMSLNPPLPPFGAINKLELDWKKIYPPFRFIELCHAAKRVVGERGFVLDFKFIDWIYAWKAHVEALYLSQGGTFSHLDKDIDGYLPSNKSVPFLALIAKENSIMQAILQNKSINTAGMAEKFPEVLRYCTGLELYAMLRHGHVLFMNYFGESHPFLIPFKFEDRTELFMPPLVIYDDGNGCNFNCWCSGEFASCLIDYNLFHYPLHDIILRREPSLYLPHSPLISKERRKEQWRHLQKTFSYIF
jgi:hypothetical protein